MKEFKIGDILRLNKGDWVDNLVGKLCAVKSINDEIFTIKLLEFGFPYETGTILSLPLDYFTSFTKVDLKCPKYLYK